MAVLNTGLAKTSAEAYTIPYSCRFDQASDAEMSRLPSEEGNLKTWAFSAWVKKCGQESHQLIFGGVNTSGAANRTIVLKFDNADRLVVTDWHDYELESERKFRDPSAWLHIFMQYDTTQTTESNRIKIWVNGEVHALTENTDGYFTGWQGYPPEDHETMLNMAGEYSRLGGGGPQAMRLDGYMAEVYFFDGASIFSDDSGTANTGFNVNSFGETGDYGEWKPKEYDGDASHGTNGFYFDFSDSAALGDDASGSVDWTVSNIAAADQMVDSPTNNFATTNVLWSKSSITHSEGNLKTVTASGEMGTTATINQSTGKWYFEVLLVAQAAAQALTGLSDTNNFNTSTYPGGDTYSWGIYSLGGQCYYNRSGASTLGSYTTGDIIGIAYDMDTGNMWYAKNGSWLEGDPAAGTGATHTNLTGSLGPATGSGAGVITQILNTGQDSSFAGEETAQGNADGNGIGDFYYTPPTGYLALCTSNLPDVAVTPSEHFNTVLWSGDDASSHAITGVGFQPDFVWLKERTSTSNHLLMDAIRGAGTVLFSNDTSAESSSSTYAQSFDTDGFTVGDSGAVNNDGDTYVAWNWKAASTASGTTTGSGTGKAYSARYNTDAGFSIISWTGNETAGHEIPHHLGAVPEMIFQKSRDSSHGSWATYHEAYTNDKKFYLDTTAAPDSLTDWMDFDATNMTSNEDLNNNNLLDHDFITYCFRSIDGYSKMGSYTGNDDSNDGTFVYTGFRPAWVMIKTTDVGGWNILDSTRSTYNEMGDIVAAHENNAESEADSLDFLSNGFKIMSSSGDFNSIEPYIYIAFAETPFKYSNAR